MAKRWYALVAILLCLLIVRPVWAQPDEDDDADQIRAEVALGRDATRQYERTVHVVGQGADVVRLRRILKKLVPFSGRPKLPYSVKVVESGQVNAITFPGGKIYVFRGLLAQKMDDAMLAGVLAHEVVHGARSHGYRRVLQMKALGAITGGQDSLNSGLIKVLLLSGVGRTYENQADRLAVHVAAKAGYDPHGLLKALQVLQRLDHDQPGLFTGLLATHPPLKDRIKKVQAEIKAMGR